MISWQQMTDFSTFFPSYNAPVEVLGKTYSTQDIGHLSYTRLANPGAGMSLCYCTECCHNSILALVL